MAEQVLYEVRDGVATVTLNRPERLNALTPQMRMELLDVFAEADADDAVRAVVITGAGRGFCAGADMAGGGKTFNYSGGEDDPRTKRDGGGQVVMRIFESLKPTIAAINGPAVGFGAALTLPMDFRVMAEGARMGFVAGARGIVPDAVASWFLPRVVGLPTALDWCLTARLFGAEEARDSGLVRSLHPADEVLGAAYRIAEGIAANVAPVSAALTRRMLWRMAGADHPMHAHRLDSAAIAATGRLADAAEGVESFLQKRTPEWTLSPHRDLPEGLPWPEEPEFDADAGPAGYATALDPWRA